MGLGEFRLLAQVGAGCNAVAYRAGGPAVELRRLDRDADDGGADPSDLAAARKRLSLAARLDHPNLRRIVAAWWRRNDAPRDGGGDGAEAAEDPAALANLEALARLLGGAAEDALVMKAEVLHQLGRFDAALAILSGVTSDGWRGIAGQIRALCDRGDRAVRELRIEP